MLCSKAGPGVDRAVKAEKKNNSFMFVPGHASLHRNECADKLPGKAAVRMGRAMERADIILLRDTDISQKQKIHSLLFTEAPGILLTH